MKLKRLFSAVLAVVMVGYNLGGVIPVMADDDPTIQNEPPVVINGDDDDPNNDIVLSKVVESVPGWANKWKVTLRIEVPAVTVTSDTILVIDQSNSMSGSRLREAKAAADSLAEQLLPEGNTVNRIAVLSFGSEVHERTGFSNDYDTVSDAIGDINASGGTFTQAGLHDAVSLLSTSTATYKNIILLSDGVPTYSYRINNVGDHLQNGGPGAHTNQLETTIITNQSDFDYTTRVGNGGYNIPDGQEMWHQYWHQGNQYRYYNHGNSAISEANFFNNSNSGTLWTIAFNAGMQGNNVLKQMASSDDNYYESGTGGLAGIFNKIAGSISSLITNASVHDTMGVGVTTDGETSLDWKPAFELINGKYIAEKEYEVEMNENVFTQTASGGFYALNDSAVLTYSDSEGEKTAEFPIPKAKPFDLDVEKVLTVDGEETYGKEFTFTISGNGVTNTYSVKSGEDHIIPVPMPIKLGEEYTITETGVGASNDIAFEYYDAPEYTVRYNGDESETNKFVVTSEHGDVVDIVIKNNYETTNVAARKVWSDDSDRDGLRKKYDDLYAVVKDGNKYVAMEEITSSGGALTFSKYSLPKNRNGSPISYTVVEATGCEDNDGVITCDDYFESGESMNDGEYEVTIEKDSNTGEFVITNKHTPETVNLIIKKKWDTSAGTLPTVRPGFVTMEVTNDQTGAVSEVTLEGENYDEWTGTFVGYKYEKGEEIGYTVEEKEIGANGALDNNYTLYVYQNGALEGKWVATHNGMEVTNTWTPAETVYTGAGAFYIEKLDQDGDPIEGVTFTVGTDDYTTGANGKVKVEFSKSADKPKDSYTFKITESEAPEYYELIDGTEELIATTDLDLTVDKEGLKNTYKKTFSFEVTTAVKGYNWSDKNVTLTATDQELADSLKIEKTFKGISADAFEENSQIEFTISGPDGFTEMTVGIGDDECKISDSKLVCEIDGDDVLLPVGEYTVTESNAEIDNFTYTSKPTNGKVTEKVELGETATFEFENIYAPIEDVSFKVKKDWKDDDDRDGLRPDKLEVTLLADGEPYDEEDPVELKGDDWEYEWTELPRVNKDAEEIVYSVEEEDLGDDYESDGGKLENGVFIITNTHEPEMHDDLIVKKLWAGKGVDLARPDFVVVDLLANGKVIKHERIFAGQNNEWTHTFTDLYKNEGGEEIDYSVQESAIGNTSFAENESTIIVYKEDGETLDGKWVKSIKDFEITNTWTPATSQIEYDGESEFTIVKVDEDSKPLSGVTFEIDDGEGEADKEETDKNGEITVKVPITTTDEDESDAKTEESFEYEISEYEAKEGYDLVEGSATVTVNCTSTLSADPTTLVNNYTKTCTFEETDDNDKYDWDDGDLILTVINERNMAKSLTIVKTFSGVNVEILKDITFTIEGPEDFGDEGVMTLTAGEDCRLSEDKITCEVDAEIPTGDYTVTESNADIEHFTLTVSGDNGEEKTVNKNDVVEFKINNKYVVDKTYYRVVKVWEDEHDKDGVRPEQLKVELSANGEVIKTKNLSADDETEDEWGEDLEKSDVWEYTFEELPVADKNAEVIEYYAEESLETEEYEQVDEISGMYTTIFVNAHEPEVDPCEEGGCGGDVPLPPVEAPETGRLTLNQKNESVESAWIGNMIGGAVMVIMGVSLVSLGKRKETRLTK